MLICYLRSSSYNAWDFCQFSYFLTYTLGLENISNSAAERGNIVHKALEMLACQKLAMQQNNPFFNCPEIHGVFNTKRFTVTQAVKQSWEYHTRIKQPQIYKWSNDDYEDCHEWTEKALAWAGGAFNPLNRNIIWPERYFDFTIDEPWAHYDFKLPSGRRLEGQLAVKGTIDLTCMVDDDPNYPEMVDWKTGKRKDWNTGEIKDYNKLRKDPQLLMYYYALARLLPNAKEMMVTIVFINDGGPYSLPYTRSDVGLVEEMLKKRFEEIKKNNWPARIMGGPHGWKCSKFCHFGKTKASQPDAEGKTICDYMYGELKTLGMDRLTKKYLNEDKLNEYGDGGGKQGTSANG